METEITFKPELPKVKFKKDDGITYEVTDIRYLNQNATNVFFEIMEAITKNPEITEVVCDMTDYGEDETRIIIDIIMSIDCGMRKRGRNGFWAHELFICEGARIHKGEDKTTVTFMLRRGNVKRIHDYCKGKDKINYYDMVATVSRERHYSVGEVCEIVATACESEWMDKCYRCRHVYKRVNDDDTLYCRCKTGCKFEEVERSKAKTKGENKP